MNFTSKCVRMGNINLNIPFEREYLYMHPIQLESFKSLPGKMDKFNSIIKSMIDFLPYQKGKSYVTIDRKKLNKGETHRRGGVHIDGNYCFGWGGSGWSCGTQGKYLPSDKHLLQYGSKLGGMIIVSDEEACKIWEGEIEGLPGQGGDCNHLTDQLNYLPTKILNKNTCYWLNSMGVHESLPLNNSCERTLIRLTLPENYPSLI